jgi:hypothetical protein
VYAFALVLNVKGKKHGWLEWWWLGVFIAPTTIPAVAVDGCTGQFGGARDMTCSLSGACHIIWPFGFGAVDRWSPLSSCGTGQSGGTPDSSVHSDFAVLTSNFYAVHCSLFTTVDRWAQLTVAPVHTRYVRCTPDMSDAHQSVQWIIVEWLWKNPRATSSWGALAWAPDSVRCATGSTHTYFCSKLCRVPQLIFFVGLCWTLCS